MSYLVKIFAKLKYKQQELRKSKMKIKEYNIPVSNKLNELVKDEVDAVFLSKFLLGIYSKFYKNIGKLKFHKAKDMDIINNFTTNSKWKIKYVNIIQNLIQKKTKFTGKIFFDQDERVDKLLISALDEKKFIFALKKKYENNQDDLRKVFKTNLFFIKECKNLLKGVLDQKTKNNNKRKYEREQETNEDNFKRKKTIKEKELISDQFAKENKYIDFDKFTETISKIPGYSLRPKLSIRLNDYFFMTFDEKVEYDNSKMHEKTNFENKEIKMDPKSLRIKWLPNKMFFLKGSLVTSEPFGNKKITICEGFSSFSKLAEYCSNEFKCSISKKQWSKKDKIFLLYF